MPSLAVQKPIIFGEVYRQIFGQKFSLNFRLYIRQYTSQKENFEYGYSHPNASLQSCLKLEGCKLHKAAHHPKKCDIINVVKLFSTVFDVIKSDVML